MEELLGVDDKLSARVRMLGERHAALQADGKYFYNQPIEDLVGGVRVRTAGREMLMFASYSYLGLIGHPKINAAAIAAVERYGSGTHGVRLLAGTLTLHRELEETIARFKGTEDAVTYSSGYVTNLAAISTMVGRHDVVISDKLNQVGADSKFLDATITSNNAKIDSLDAGLGALVDTDLSKESANLQALQIRQQLGTQALSLSNQAPQALLSLFK